MAYAVRKRRNKPKLKLLSVEQWAELFKLYADGHSINSCSSVFDVSHHVISDKLKEAGIYRPAGEVPATEKNGWKRKEIIPKGRFADSDFFKK